MGNRGIVPMPQHAAAGDGATELEQLLSASREIASASTARARIDGVLVGRVVAFANDGAIPLVVYSGQPGVAAISARTTLDLHAAHIGREVVLAFDAGDPGRPIVIGCLQSNSPSLPEGVGDVELDADGRRLLVSAKEQIVLRCGKASITLTSAGKVVIQGAYVSNRSSGVLRLKGGSVQIN